MNKLMRELNKVQEKKKQQIDGDHLVEAANKLLLEIHTEETKILEILGLDHKIKYSRKLQEDITRTKLAQEKYNKEVYTGSEIKELCNKYDLRILPSSKYNGEIPVDLARKVEEFTKKHKLTIASSNCFYILAPVEMFNTIKHVPKNMDPILFYKEGGANGSSYREEGVNQKDKLINIHYWGNDFSPLRQFRWIFSSYKEYASEVSNLFVFILSMIPIFFVLILQLIGIYLPLIFIFIASIASTTALLSIDKKRIDELWNKIEK